MIINTTIHKLCIKQNIQFNTYPYKTTSIATEVPCELRTSKWDKKIPNMQSSGIIPYVTKANTF